MMELRPRDDQLDEERERLLSTLETATLVHGQIKVSLMLIELKLRNNLACVVSDHQTQSSPHMQTQDSLKSHLSKIHSDAMAAIEQVNSVLDEQMAKLEGKASEEAVLVKKTLETKMNNLKRTEKRQSTIEREVAAMVEEEKAKNRGAVGDSSPDDVYVSRKVMERLQKEVLQVVERVKEKNEEIGRLKTTIQEHKVREQSLMEELQRLVKDRDPGMKQHACRRGAQGLSSAKLYEEAPNYEAESYVEETVETDVYEEVTIVSDEDK
jgi:hypothetical protein